MSTETLRRAAALMRERSHDAAEAWGGDAWSTGETGYDDRQGLTYDIHSRGALVAAAGCEELSEHIASWHPAVALAVADWLDRTASLTPSDPHNDGERCETCQNVMAALTVARAYLGESA